MSKHYVGIDRTASGLVGNLEELTTDQHNRIQDLWAENQKLKSDLEFIRKERRRLEEKLVAGGLL